MSSVPRFRSGPETQWTHVSDPHTVVRSALNERGATPATSFWQESCLLGGILGFQALV